MKVPVACSGLKKVFHSLGAKVVSAILQLAGRYFLPVEGQVV